LLLCKGKNKVIAEYALQGINQPLGVSEYQLVEALPKNLEADLPTVAKLEAEKAIRFALGFVGLV
jgi:YhcG PDDEXK nuclease domain